MQGKCRRYPKQIYVNVEGDDERGLDIWSNRNSRFPEINESDWCGEWKRKTNDHTNIAWSEFALAQFSDKELKKYNDYKICKNCKYFQRSKNEKD